MSRARTAAIVLSLDLAACGGSIVAGQGSIGGASPVVSEMQRAQGIAGHPIALVIDSAITSGRSREETETMVAGAAEVVADDLSTLRRQDPAAFGAEVPRLTRIECRYGDGGAQPVRWEGTTLVLTRNYRWQVLASGDIGHALRDDYYAALARRFAGVTPEQVAPADRPDFFAFVIHDVPQDNGAWLPPLAPPSDVDRVLRLSSVAGTSDPKLAADLRTWLFERSRSMALADPAEFRLPEQGAARAAWVQWLNVTLPSATPSEKQVVASAVFENMASINTGRTGIAGATLEGFDLFGFGLSVADAWIAAGHPTEPVEDASHQLFRLVLEPPDLDTYGELPRFNYGHSPWLGAAFVADPQGKRLADALAARNDPGLIGQVIYNLPPGKEGVSPFANLLQQLERYPATWRRTVVMLIEQEMAYMGCEPFFVEQANRAWHDVPALRGTALHIVACREGFHRGISDSYFKTFAGLYGTTIGASLFGSFLDDGPGALRLADTLWPAMSPGWSRASVIVPHIAAFLADPRVRAGQDEEPMKTLGALATRLCEDGPAEVAHFHEALAALAKNDAATARALAKVLDDTAPGRCAPAAAEGPPTARRAKRRH
jgi:hypothetical protein